MASDEQIERLIAELRKSREEDDKTKLKTKNGFLAWLNSLGLQTLANKLASSDIWDEIWNSITNFISNIFDKIVDILG